MEAGNYVGIALFAIGGGLSFAVWYCGFFFRRRIRGPARLVMMTVFLIMWYVSLLPIMNSRDYGEWLTQLTKLGVHSIWIWWAVAIFKIERQIHKEAKRSNFKTGVYHATGVHIVNTEIRKMREKRRAEKEATKHGRAEPSKQPPPGKAPDQPTRSDAV
jgi:magnesium-transporting ATPase (P-type)